MSVSNDGFLQRQINERPLTTIGAIIALGMAVFFGGMVLTIDSFPDPVEDCREALVTSAVISATEANNGNILCKIIDADSVERSVWLDSDVVVLDEN